MKIPLKQTVIENIFARLPFLKRSGKPRPADKELRTAVTDTVAHNPLALISI